MENWKWNDAPAQNGKVAIVTGANIGLGLNTTMVLAEKGAKVVMACRSKEKAENARRAILQELPGVLLDIIPLDLSSFESVKKFSEEFSEKYDKLDLLINNAGVMMPPYEKTKDGFELQFQANYLGHFFLTSLLLPKLQKAEESRVISLSSIAHKRGDIYFDDINFEKNYDRQKAYGQSKLACLMFAYELQRRFERKSMDIKSIAAHPGIADTALMRYLPKWIKFIAPVLKPFMAQSGFEGAQPTLRAAMDTQLKGGEYIGPSGSGERKGKPVIVDSTNTSKDMKKAEELWKLTEKFVGKKFFEPESKSKSKGSAKGKSVKSKTSTASTYG